jgi:hypothetical protein
MTENTLQPWTDSRRLLTSGNGYQFFMVIVFRPQKSTQSLISPVFFLVKSTEHFEICLLSKLVNSVVTQFPILNHLDLCTREVESQPIQLGSLQQTCYLSPILSQCLQLNIIHLPCQCRATGLATDLTLS